MSNNPYTALREQFKHIRLNSPAAHLWRYRQSR